MSFEALVISHILTALAAVFGTHAFLRHVAGWKTAFEHSVATDFAVIKHALGLGSVQAPHAVSPSSSSAAIPIAPYAGGGASSPAPAGPPPIPVS